MLETASVASGESPGHRREGHGGTSEEGEEEDAVIGARGASHRDALGFQQMHKEFGGRFAALDDKMDAGFARVDARLDRVDRDLDSVKSDLQIVKSDLTLVKQDVARLQLAVTEHGRQLELVRPVTQE